MTLGIMTDMARTQNTSTHPLQEWLENPSSSVYFFPANDAGPDAATVTRDGILVLVQCKFTEPLLPEKTVSRPPAFGAFSSVFANTFYRPRNNAMKI
jgi:hypothetical protein